VPPREARLGLPAGRRPSSDAYTATAIEPPCATRAKPLARRPTGNRVIRRM
jgi:hypothetical protein